MNFGPWNTSKKIWNSIVIPIPKVGVHVSVEVHSLTLSHTFGSMKRDSWASFLARTFASPCLGREPKAKVVTQKHNINQS
jgi:hypothetical protein